MIQIHITKACAHLCSPPELLTAGMAKAVTVEFVFSDDWDRLTKTAVFTNGRTTIDVLPAKWDGDIVTIPHEILTTAGRTARVGVYGTNASGVVLPTVWATLGKVQPAAEPSGDTSTDPTLPVWAQLQEIIGDLADLTTTAKNNLVAAINEAAKTGSGGAGSIDLRTADGYIQYSNDGGATWENLIAIAELKGEKGDTGATGPQGSPGITPNIQIGTVTTLSAGSDATASMSGTAENPVLDLGIPKGEAGGSDLSLGLTGAAVGQIAKITAVDADGKPTAWEAVSEQYELLKTINIAEEINALTVTQDDNGNHFLLDSVLVYCDSGIGVGHNYKTITYQDNNNLNLTVDNALNSARVTQFTAKNNGGFCWDEGYWGDSVGGRFSAFYRNATIKAFEPINTIKLTFGEAVTQGRIRVWGIRA